MHASHSIQFNVRDKRTYLKDVSNWWDWGCLMKIIYQRIVISRIEILSIVVDGQSSNCNDETSSKSIDISGKTLRFLFYRMNKNPSCL